MKRFFRFSVLSSVASIVLAVTSLFGNQALAEEVKYKVPSATQNQFIITFNQTAEGNVGSRYSHKVINPDLSNPGRSLPHYEAILPACKTQSDLTCVESVESKRIDENEWHSGVLSANQLDVTKLDLSRQLNDFKYSVWPADISSSSEPLFKPLPAGGVASSWDLVEAPHSKGISYLAEVSFLDGIQPKVDPVFSVNLEPWDWRCTSTKNCDHLGYYSGNSLNFPSQIEFRVTVRMNALSKRIGKWAVGRIAKPSVSTKNERLTISGSPVSYPMAYSLLSSRTECSDKLSKVLSQYFPFAGNLCLDEKSRGIDNSAPNISALPFFDGIGGQVTQNGLIQRWTFSTVQPKNFDNNCLSTEDFSLATSNAMLYSTQPPVWNKDEGTLSYRIASPHEDESGQINKGNYSLALPKSVADCLWKFDVSKGSATISITNSSGVQNIAISNIRSTPGWIYFDASGFTFSSPEIKVKFLPLVSAESASALSQLKKTTITCIKGKHTKKVSAVNPKCPAGYKKK